MLAINIGMPRSGTLWRYRLIRDLMIAGGGTDALKIRKQFLLHPFFSGLNADINTLKAKRLIPASIPSYLGKKYILNSHAGPEPTAIRLISAGHLKVVYGYRDPRDCLLSIMEYSQRNKPQYSANFLEVKNLEDGIRYLQPYIEIWRRWTEMPGVLTVRYEDMLEDFSAGIDRILDYLNLEVSASKLTAITESYLPGIKPDENARIHFESGKAQRFRIKFTPEERQQLLEAFGPVLERMGYPA